jgi:hypothetical protein
MGMKRSTGFVLLAFVIVAGSAASGSATEAQEPQTNRYLGDRWNVTIQGVVGELSSDVSAGRQLGALIDLEELLGFDEQKTTWGLDAFYRLTRNRKHTIRVTYIDFTRDAYAAVSGTVPIFDVEFIGDVKSRFENRVGTITYQYSFTNAQKTEAGISGGLGFYKYGLGIEGRYLIDNNPDLGEFGSRSENVLAPVPTVGFFINHAFRPNLILDLSTSFISLSIGPHEGRIFNTAGNITWYFTRHFGLGLGLTGSDVVYENTGSGTRIKAELRQTAITINASLVF